MTKQEYHELLACITAKKAKNEQEDTALERQINNLIVQLKAGSNVAAQDEVDRCKRRRFDVLKREREELCEGFIREKTGFEGDIIPIYTTALNDCLRGEAWTKFMLNHCGCPEPR
jgi:hypothetical protein